MCINPNLEYAKERVIIKNEFVKCRAFEKCIKGSNVVKISRQIPKNDPPADNKIIIELWKKDVLEICAFSKGVWFKAKIWKYCALKEERILVREGREKRKWGKWGWRCE